MQVVDLMRPLTENEFRIESFYELMKEMHFKNYSRLTMQREHSVTKRKRMVEVDPNDKEKNQVFQIVKNIVE